jgi:hypothetical protein
VAAKKSTGSKDSTPHVRQTTTDVDLEWLGKVLEEEKSSGKRARKGKGPPPVRSQSDVPTVPRHDTIEVDSKWLIAPVAKKWRKKTGDEPRKPLPLPAVVAVKPMGRLPPVVPREDDEDSARPAAPKAPGGGGRTSKRPPSTRR